MINLSLNELKLIVKSETLKPEEDLIKILSKPKPKISLSRKKIKEINKDFSELRHGFSKPKRKEFLKQKKSL